MNTQIEIIKAPQLTAINDDLTYDDLLEDNVKLLQINYFTKKNLMIQKRDLEIEIASKMKRIILLENLIIIILAAVVIVPFTFYINM